jgi:hypothetical protein
MKSEKLSGQTCKNVCRGVYVDAINGEIMTTLAELIPVNTNDKKFLNLSKKVQKIIDREFVEYENQIKETK